MRTRVRARPLVLTAALVLGVVSEILCTTLRPASEPPIGLPPGTSATPSTTTVGTTTTASRATTTTPTSPPTSNSLPGKDIARLPTEAKVVALTFDVGGNTPALPAILRTLTTEQVQATFFIAGDFAQHDPDDLRAILTAGQRIGDNSTIYPHMSLLPDDEIAVDVLPARQELVRGGVDPRPLSRFPHGESGVRTIGATIAQGYTAVRWTVDTLGWHGTSGGSTTRSVVDRVIEALQPGEIVSTHIETLPDDGAALDAEALPDMITQLRAHGYGFVTPDAVLDT